MKNAIAMILLLATTSSAWAQVAGKEYASINMKCKNATESIWLAMKYEALSGLKEFNEYPGNSDGSENPKARFKFVNGMGSDTRFIISQRVQENGPLQASDPALAIFIKTADFLTATQFKAEITRGSLEDIVKNKTSLSKISCELLAL